MSGAYHPSSRSMSSIPLSQVVDLADDRLVVPCVYAVSLRPTRREIRLPGSRLVGLVEPDVEEVIQLHPAALLGQRNEPGRGHVSVAVLRGPRAHQLEEDGVSDLF